MRRLLLLLTVTGIVSTAALVSLAQPEKAPTPVADGAERPKFVIAQEAKNPWTNLNPNAAAEQFQFAIVSDRAGGHRPGVFSKAVHQVNLLQPEFVMSVGDLIEGSLTNEEANHKEWNEFDSYVKQFQMPFFYVPGNHDVAGKARQAVYLQRYGRPYYHFLYKNCLFVALNSNDVTGVDDKGQPKYGGNKISKEQLAWLEGVLRDNAGVRWTFVFLHHPIWSTRDFTESGWLECEKLLAGRKHHVFCGHVHNFRMYPRNGTNYYQLATTGGGSALRGLEYGEFDQVAWITMKNDGPVISHVLLNGVLPHDLAPIESAETGRKETDQSTLGEVYGTVTFDGKTPPPGLQIVFTEILSAEETKAKKIAYVGNSRLNADGSYLVYANRGAKGVKPGRYVITVTLAPSIVVDPSNPRDNPVPEKYRAASKTPFKADVKKGEKHQLDFAIESK